MCDCKRTAQGSCPTHGAEKPFDPTKPCALRAYRDKLVRILATDVEVGPPIVGVTRSGTLHRWNADGSFGDYAGENGSDLVNVPERREEYSNIYKGVTESCMRHAKPLSVVKGYNLHLPKLGAIKYTFEDDELISVELIK